MGFYLQFAGQSAQAVDYLELAKRLSPVDTVRNLAFLGMAYFMNGGYHESLAVWEKRMSKFPARPALPYIFLAATYAMLEKSDEAAATADKLIEIHPDFNLSQWHWLSTYKLEENRQRLYDAAKKAGIPEHPKS